MAAILKLKDDETSCHYYNDVMCSSQPVLPSSKSHDPRRQGQDDDAMLPHHEELEEDEEEGGVALIYIFNPFPSCIEL